MRFRALSRAFQGYDVGSDNIGHGGRGFYRLSCRPPAARRRPHVVGLDNLNDYYDPALKQRGWILAGRAGFCFEQVDLADRAAMERLFATHRFANVVHLAAQAGVRYSIDHPHAYVDANLEGFVNVLEGCRHHGCGHLVYASSSSVYGANTKLPFSVDDSTDHPVSLYAATKKANELMAHSYSHLYRLPVTGLRFFTVYGPWGRPDMAIFLFTKAIVEGTPIKLFNHGRMRRDFTYIDDVTRVVLQLIDQAPRRSGRRAPARIYNVGNNRPEELTHVVQCWRGNWAARRSRRCCRCSPAT